MNEYKITYTGESEGYRLIIDRTESAAKKYFREISKELGSVTIQSVELVSDNAMATKRNEWETLEIIRQLVADLGPESYLATAFEGVFEDAAGNIENDFAFSMKARFEDAEEKLRQMGSNYNALKRDMGLIQGQLTAAQKQIAALTRRQLPEKLRLDLLEMTTAEAQVSRDRMATAADKMAVGADNPACVLFKDSVALYRTEKARAEAMEQRVAALDAMKSEEE